MSIKRKVVLFGAGNCGKRHAQEISDEVLCFVDNDVKKQGDEIQGKPIISPEQIAQYDYDAIVIASIYESEIRRQLVSMGLADKISTNVSRNGGSGVVPVNFNHFDCSPEKIASDAEYAFNIAKGYLSKFDDAKAFIRGKAILELGPGINFGTALVMLAWGAKSYIVCDRYLSQYDENYHSKVYLALRKLILAEDNNANTEVLDACIQSSSHKVVGLECVQSPLEELAAIFPNEFDITLSNAVFEHLYNPLAAFQSLYACTALGGVGSHQVDFRDHRDFERPLEFLLTDELSFHALMHDACCEFGNRVRPFQMTAMFEAAGFSEVAYQPNMFVDRHYMKEFMPRLACALASSFSQVSEEKLRAISANFILEKCISE